MSADEILRVVRSQGGGVELRFSVSKLSTLSVSERQQLARRMVDNNTGSHRAVRTNVEPETVRKK
jgi:hypothetical protein